MIKVLVQLKNNCIHFKVRKKLTNEYKNMLNTNIISDNEILFSDTYILENSKIVASFLDGLANHANANTAVIEVEDISLLIISIIKSMPHINNLILSYDSVLSHKECELILKCPNIKYLNCYNLYEFMIEQFNHHRIIVENRCEILFASRFMEDNGINRLSSMYYKKSLLITLPLSEDDEQDIKYFCSINNNYLRTIHLKHVQLADLEFIIETLKKNKLKNIRISIHEDIINDDVINYLRQFKEKQSKKYKIYVKISYSKKFIQKNILPQTNINILKLCCLLSIAIIICVFGYVFWDNYQVAKEVEEVQNNIQAIIDTTDTSEIINNLNELNANTKLEVKNEKIVSLLPTNDETVGWLNVLNTNIDYAVVQHSDNEYYLKHNFNKQPSNAGWVFMDYRNNPIDLDDNTILYAHNRYSNGIMFGTLGNLLTKEWLNNEENHYISFNTIYENMTWRVFSVYKTPYTVDYLAITFNNNTDKQDFYNMLKNRSIYDFGVTPDKNDKIITLSTCSTDGGRIVVHAVKV